MGARPKTLSTGAAFGEQVKAVRKLRGLTQEQLAKRLNMTRGTLAKIEANTEHRADGATVDELLSIAAALNVAPVHLLTPFEDDARVRVTGAGVFIAGRLRLWIRGGWPLRDDDDRGEYARTIPPSEFEQLMLQAARRRRDEGSPANEHYLPSVDTLDQALDHRDDRWTLEPHRDRQEENR